MDIRAILNHYALKELACAIDAHNTSSDGPYHNSAHAYNVMHETLRYLDRNVEDQGKTRNILAAALMHDFRHTLGSSDDSTNVDIACSWVEPLLQMCRENADGRELNAAYIRDSIRCTMFNGKEFPNEPNDSYQAALRDADLSTAFYLPDDKAAKLMRGLYYEIRVSNPGLTWGQYIEGQIRFLTNATFYTEVGKERHARKLGYVVDCLKELKL